MNRFLKVIIALLALTCPAWAQTGTSVKQSGFVTPGHGVTWVTNGIIQDGGTVVGTVTGPQISTVGGLASWANGVGTVLQDANGTTVNGNYTWSGTQTFSSSIIISTSLTVPTIYGGVAANSSLSLIATSNVSPSGETINITSAAVNIASNHGGGTVVTIGNGGTGGGINIYSPTGTGPQAITGPNGGVGTITLPATTTTLAGLAITQTWTGTNTYNTPIVFTGSVNVPSAGTGQIGATAGGLILIGNGLSFDISLLTRSGAQACGLVANTAIFDCVLSPGANTAADSLILANGNAASSGNQQFSGSLHLSGQGWKTNATAASQSADFIIDEQPLQGAANPNSTLVFSSSVNGGSYTNQAVMTDGNGFVTLSTAVGGTAALIAGTQGDLQIGRSANAGFLFFGTSSGASQYISLSSANVWVFGGNSSANVVNFGTAAGATPTLQSTNNGAPSADSFTIKATTVVLQGYSGASTVNCGAAGVSSCSLVMAGSASGAVTLIPTSAASGTVTLPNGATTLAGLATTETFSAAQTFSNQLINTAARTIASATAATLDDIFFQAETTTITGNTGSPITALSKFHLGQPTLTDSSSVTVTTAATLTIDNAPAQAGSVTITNAYALNVVAGSTFLGGKVFMNGLTAGSGTKALCLNATANEVQTDTSATICGISALRYKNLIAEITPDQGLDLLALHGESYRYKPGPLDDGKIHISLIADEMGAMNHDCAEWSHNGVENYMDRCFEAYQVALNKKLWATILELSSRLPVNDNLRREIERARRAMQ